MPTSKDLREGSRIAIATARALGSNDRSRSRNLAAQGLALALEAERMDCEAARRNRVPTRPQETARQISTIPASRRAPLESAERI